MFQLFATKAPVLKCQSKKAAENRLAMKMRLLLVAFTMIYIIIMNQAIGTTLIQTCINL